MRVEWLFLKWLVVMGLVALAAMYAQSCRQSRSVSHYESIPLVRGARTSGLPVRGVMVDPNQRDISAVVGGPTDPSKQSDFFILWRGKNGETFSATFPKGDIEGATLSKVSPAGQVQQLHDFRAHSLEKSPARDGARLASAEATLHAIVNNLAPRGSDIPGR